MPGDKDAVGIPTKPRHHSATHIAIATPLTAEQILAVGQREGWPARSATAAASSA